MQLRVEPVAVMDITSDTELWEEAFKCPQGKHLGDRSISFRVRQALVWYKENSKTLPQKTLLNALRFAEQRECTQLLVKKLF